MSKPKVVLASTSPRRIELLRAIGMEIEVRSPDADETPLKSEAPGKMVARLSLAKAESVLAQVVLANGSYPTIVIAADTIVVAPDGKKILGKPKDKAEAEKMLRSLAGKTHTVFTGYAIVAANDSKKKRISRIIKSKVTMRKLTRSDVLRYIETGEPMDKAGSYAAQGQGMALIEKIQGSYTNVVGLPICQVASDLENVFGLTLFEWNQL